MTTTARATATAAEFATERSQFDGRKTPADKPPQRLFVPGPTDVHPAVLAAQAAPMIGHRSDELESMFGKCSEQLRELYHTRARVFTVAASGTGLQEAAIRNAVDRRVINFINGAFSKRWHEVAAGCGKEAIAVGLPWSTAVKPEQVEESLLAAQSEGPVDAVTVVHNETSTGVASPVQAISECVRKVSPDTLILVGCGFIIQRGISAFRRLGIGPAADILAEGAGCPSRVGLYGSKRPSHGARSCVDRSRLVFRFCAARQVPAAKHDSGNAGYLAVAGFERAVGPHSRRGSGSPLRPPRVLRPDVPRLGNCRGLRTDGRGRIRVRHGDDC